MNNNRRFLKLWVIWTAILLLIGLAGTAVSNGENVTYRFIDLQENNNSEYVAEMELLDNHSFVNMSIDTYSFTKDRLSFDKNYTPTIEIINNNNKTLWETNLSKHTKEYDDNLNYTVVIEEQFILFNITDPHDRLYTFEITPDKERDRHLDHDYMLLTRPDTPDLIYMFDNDGVLVGKTDLPESCGEEGTEDKGYVRCNHTVHDIEAKPFMYNKSVIISMHNRQYNKVSLNDLQEKNWYLRLKLYNENETLIEGPINIRPDEESNRFDLTEDEITTHREYEEKTFTNQLHITSKTDFFKEALEENRYLKIEIMEEVSGGTDQVKKQSQLYTMTGESSQEISLIIPIEKEPEPIEKGMEPKTLTTMFFTEGWYIGVIALIISIIGGEMITRGGSLFFTPAAAIFIAGIGLLPDVIGITGAIVFTIMIVRYFRIYDFIKER